MLVNGAQFIAVGDLHIGVHSSFGLTSDVVYEALGQVVDYANRTYVRQIILLGDVFDTAYPHQWEVTRLFCFFMKHPNIRWHIIPGNHDIGTDTTDKGILSHSLMTIQGMVSQGVLPNVALYMDPVDTEIDGIPFRFLPYPYDGPSTERINVAHVSLDGAIADNGHPLKDGADAEGCWWVCGHLHTAQTFYPGTLYQTSILEDAQKGFMLIQASMSGGLRVAQHLIPINPPYKLVKVKPTCTQDIDGLPPYTPNIIYYFYATSAYPLPTDLLTRYPNAKILPLRGSKGKAQTIEQVMGDAALEASLDVQTFIRERIGAGTVLPNIDPGHQAYLLNYMQNRLGIRLEG